MGDEAVDFGHPRSTIKKNRKTSLAL